VERRKIVLSNIQHEAPCAFSSCQYVWYYRVREDGCKHLRIRRRDWQPITSWNDIQNIKNYTFGKETVAIEVYPRESKKVDEMNMRHLFVLTQEQIVGLKLKGL
jgi:hypothetical protein